jgi:predicted outer membrane repeat protein
MRPHPTATGIAGLMKVLLLLLCLCLCLRPAVSQSTWLAENYITITVHSTADAQAVVSDCYPYYNASLNANCTLRSAWSVLAELAPYQPVTILLPDRDIAADAGDAALIVLDAALGNLEMLSTYDVIVDGRGSTVLMGEVDTTEVELGIGGGLNEVEAGGSTAYASPRFISYELYDSSGSDSALPTLNLRNITLTGFGASDNNGGVIHIYGDINAHISDVTFTGNTASGIFAANITTGILQVSNCEFSYSNATKGAGAHLQQHVAGASFSDCVFHDLGAVLGGALYLGDSITDTSVTSCTFLHNTATYGGAIYADNNNQNLSLSSCVFSHNIATYRGGGVALGEGNILRLVGSEFSYNTATSGGGLSMQESNTATLQNSNLSQNRASLYGGGMYGLHLTQLNFVGENHINGNIAGEIGGGLLLAQSPLWSVDAWDGELRFMGNGAKRGSGVFLKAAQVTAETLHDVVFERNIASVGGTFYWMYEADEAVGMSEEPKGMGNVAYSDNTAPYGSEAATQAVSVIGPSNVTYGTLQGKFLVGYVLGLTSPILNPPSLCHLLNPPY